MRRTFLAVMAALLLLSFLAVPSSARPTRWAVCGEWRRVAVPDEDTLGRLTGVAVVSPDEAWAVGSLGDESVSASLALHWTGMRWERATFPKTAQLNAVTVASATDVWAVGSRDARTMPEDTPPHLFTARWTGTRWESMPTELQLRGTLEDVAAIPGTRQLWAVGYGVDSAPLVIRWTGERWHRASVPLDRGHLTGVVAFRESAWAVGYVGERMIALRWDGSRWHRIDAPAGFASSIDGTRPDRLWAVGGDGSEHPALFRWNGARWFRVWTGTGKGYLSGVVVPAPGVVWAVGTRSFTEPRPLVVRRGSDGWHAATIKGASGYLTAIDGTPNNLWVTRFSNYPDYEPPYFDTYHRC
jgi:hypothetical protein